MKTAFDSSTAESFKNRGNELQALQRHDEAIQSYDRAIGLKPDYADAHYNRGVALLSLHRYAPALESFERAIELSPDDAEAYNNRAIALRGTGRHDAAIDSFGRAIELQPRYPDAYHNWGIALNDARRWDAAIEHFDRAVVVDPSDADAFYHRGHALRELERYADALTSYDRVLALNPGHPDACIHRGNVLCEIERYEDALTSYGDALAIKRDYAGALNNRGSVLLKLKRYEDAVESYDEALAVEPHDAEALGNLALALERLKRYPESLTSSGRALSIKANQLEALNVRGLALHGLGRYEEALANYQKALAVKPDMFEALNNRGNSLIALNRNEQALASFNAALAIKHDYLLAWNNRGNVLQELGRYDEALASYDQAHLIDPDYAEAHWSEALCRLLTGDFARGWEQYEWRQKAERLPLVGKRSFPRPLWLGKEDIRGKTILLHPEQGFGDTLQFCRYVPLLANTGAAIILLAPQPLKRLLLTLRASHQLLSDGDELPHFDCHCPLLSLPLAFNTRLETIPAGVPYLSADPALIAKWSHKLGVKRGTRIGIAWSGRPQHPNDRNRSMGLEAFLRVATADVTLVSLQREVRPEDERLLAASRNVVHFGPELEDFAETAALVSQMDLVVTVDTSVAHLAGALGKPVWILLPFAPDWRWLVGRKDSPWYPTARLFRQKQRGDWEGVLEELKRSLAALLES